MVKVLFAVPALMVTATLRSSGSVFSVVVNFMVAVPLPPLVGEAVHQVVPLRVSAMDKVQSEVVVKVMDFSATEVSKDSPLAWILESSVIVGLFTSGLGVGGVTGSSLPPPLQLAKRHVNIASKKNTFFII
jgi:hypothetical protein